MDIRKDRLCATYSRTSRSSRTNAISPANGSAARETIDVTNPANGNVIIAVPKLGTAETRHAIEAAEKAQKLWAAKTAKERSVILRKWHNLMMEHQEDLAQIMTAEQGKPLAESRGEVAYGASFIEFFAEEAKRIYGETSLALGRPRASWSSGSRLALSRPSRRGTSPNAMITRKAGPALAAGCAFVCKPAERNAALGIGLGRTRRACRASPPVSSVSSPVVPRILAAK